MVRDAYDVDLFTHHLTPRTLKFELPTIKPNATIPKILQSCSSKEDAQPFWGDLGGF